MCINGGIQCRFVQQKNGIDAAVLRNWNCALVYLQLGNARLFVLENHDQAVNEDACEIGVTLGGNDGYGSLFVSPNEDVGNVQNRVVRGLCDFFYDVDVDASF